jgi:hypothetical protein
MTNPPSAPAPSGVRIASTLCWIVGVVTILVTLAIGIPVIASGGGLMYLSVGLVAGVAVCAGAVLIRKQQRLGVLVILLAWALPTVYSVLNHQSVRGSLLLFVALLLAAANWKHFR